MADNITITAGTGTTVGTDDVGGVQIQRVKATWGPDGTANDTDVATGKPMPMQLRSPTGVDLLAGEYETVAAGQTAQTLGPTGATGDWITGILVIPATTSPGVVTLLDNATSIPLFVGGASSVSNLIPFYVPLGMKSVSGAWKITTGANISCIGIGNFT